MKKLASIVFLLAVVAFLQMCKCPPCPDLVPSVSVQWNENSKLVYVTIHNTGTGSATNFLVYVNADENPESSNHRPQIMHKVDLLEGCSSITLPISDFSPLAHPDNSYLDNVFQITVIVDPKGMVKECDGCGENNNEVSVPLF